MKNLSRLLLITLVCLFGKANTGSFAQDLELIFAKSAGNKTYDFARGICSDAHGNVYVIGSFDSPWLAFGSKLLKNSGYNDVFIVKYDSTGNVLWAKCAGGSSDDLGYDICADNAGNIYITGYFGSPVMKFDSLYLQNEGRADIFIAKYSSSGNVLWTKCVGGVDLDYGSRVCVDANSNLYITGCYKSPVMYFDSISVTNAGNYDIYVAKYSAEGKALWANSFGGKDDDYGSSIYADKKGNYYIAGGYSSSTIYFDTTSLSNAGDFDSYICKFDPLNNIIWAKGIGGTDYDLVKSINEDGNNNIYISGYFKSLEMPVGATVLKNAGLSDIFIFKSDTSGKVLWAKSFGGENKDFCSRTCLDKKGNSYIIGFYSSTVINSEKNIYKNINNGFDDIFIVKYDTRGNVLFLKSIGGSDTDDGAGITVDVYGNIYICGCFVSSTITIGKTILKNSSFGFSDMFVAKFH